MYVLGSGGGGVCEPDVYLLLIHENPYSVFLRYGWGL